MSIFDPIYIYGEIDTKLKSLVLNRLNKDKFDDLSSHSPDEIWFIQDSELSGQPIVVDTRPPELPTKLSEFQNDVPYLSAVSWSQVTDKPTIPTQTSQLTNDSGFVNQSYVLQQRPKWRDWFQTEWLLDALTFTALSSDSWVRMDKGVSAPTVSLEYTTNGSVWNDLTAGYQVALQNVGDRVAIRAKTTNQRMASGWSTSEANHFVGSGALKISGNINSLLNKNPKQVYYLPDYAFSQLFSSGTTNNSFRDASELTLPATSLGQYCYCRMFYYAAGLEKSPYLADATLAYACYDYMFFNCYGLNEIKIGYTGNFSGSGVPTYAFNNWVNGVSSTGTFYYNGSSTSRGVSAIPSGWTIQSF